MMVGNLKDNFSCKGSRILSSNSKTTFFVSTLSELHVLSQTIYVINTDMAASLADFTAFFQDEEESFKRGENDFKSAHVESCSYLKGEVGILVVRGGKMF